MSTPRFFYPAPLAGQTHLALPQALAHHAQRVLRLEPGQHVVLFDGLGGEYPGVLRGPAARPSVQLGAHEPTERELAGHLVLLQGLASGDKMDWILEKAVELGVSELQPIAAERSVLRLEGGRLDKRMARWQAIVQSASEQCGRNRLMRVHRPARLAAALPLLHGHTLFCHPEAGPKLPEALCGAGARLNLLVGPEGGWSTQEQALARQHGSHAAQFGPRILRTETAGLALVVACTTLLGW
ncbi:16S rRNA (uracil(1498)-N(3))-methyltransferase [Castellaniella sp.]|uniref:16S rRNA (uracil(1498)-N(3))-methyltransferase n=1 Tax=Castellaniella sp. TaxID=1955812 RepID=UPI0035690907